MNVEQFEQGERLLREINFVGKQMQAIQDVIDHGHISYRATFRVDLTRLTDDEVKNALMPLYNIFADKHQEMIDRLDEIGM